MVILSAGAVLIQNLDPAAYGEGNRSAVFGILKDQLIGPPFITAVVLAVEGAQRVELGALAALIALAGLAFTALVSFRDYELSYFAVHQSVALLLGTATLLAAYFLDFTLLGRFALPLALVFHAALVLLSLLSLGGFWLFHYTYVSTHILLRGLPPLLPLMFAVLLYALRGRRGLGIFTALTALAIQLLFCLQIPSLTDLSFLFLCNGALLLFCAHSGWFGLGAKWEALLTALPLAACTASVLVLGASWFARQLAIVLDPYPYIDGHGYQTVVLRELLQNAKFIGPGGVGPYSAQHLARWDGVGMVDLQAHALTLLVHRCGWLALIVLVTLLTALLVLAFRRCRRQESMLARLVSYAVLLSFSAQALAYLLSDLTLLPLGGGAAFPLFTFGLRTLLVNMTQLGFLLSTLRTGSVVRDRDFFTAQARPKRRLRVRFEWEQA